MPIIDRAVLIIRSGDLLAFAGRFRRSCVFTDGLARKRMRVVAMRIPNQTCSLVSLIIVAACFHAVARADNATAGQAESEVRAASKRYVEATRKGDVDALRKIWTRDGDYVDAQGRKFKAQDMIARPHG